MRRVQFLATEPHFRDHLEPVRLALPDEVRGQMHGSTKTLANDTLTVVSSWGNCRAAQKLGLPVIMFEHGAGFTYNVNHSSYAGGPGRDGVVLFCSVNEHVAERNRDAYPNARHAVVGSPKLDALSLVPKPETTPPVVAFSWHWQCQVVPETRTAFPHYRSRLNTLSRQRRGEWQPLGHAHPRAWMFTRPVYQSWRWETTREFDEVVQRASVYVCDTSSTIYEFAALDRPVIVLNAPWYRRNVEHGLRFWRDIPGIQVDHPSELDAAITSALHADTWAAERRRITELVYPHLGNAASTAANAILELL